MPTLRLFSRTLLMGILAAGTTAAPADDGGPHWGYDGGDAPGVWATLSPEYAECGQGTRQSPIDLPVAAQPDQPLAPPVPLEVFHHEHVLDIANNGHTIAVTYDDGDQLLVDGQPYRLVQYHFHAPSEHTFAGQHFPLELHLVHRHADGRLAVLAVMLEAGPHHAGYDPVLAHLPRKAGRSEHVEHVAIDVDQLLPTVRNAFSYVGSLTTPPCTEGVRWLVLRAPVALDARQLTAFAEVLHHNSRPTQPLHGRQVEVTAVAAPAAP